MVKSKGFGLQVERMEELISVGMILFGTCFFFLAFMMCMNHALLDLILSLTYL